MAPVEAGGLATRGPEGVRPGAMAGVDQRPSPSRLVGSEQILPCSAFCPIQAPRGLIAAPHIGEYSLLYPVCQF